MTDLPIPCPFCGGPATLSAFDARNQTGRGPDRMWCAFVKCDVGCVEVGATAATEVEVRRQVLATWNRRDGADRLRGALLRLVEAKNEKDVYGDTARYHYLKEGAWETAREVLREVPHGMSLVRENALKDQSYAPYCMRCSTQTRMTRIKPMLWKCSAPGCTAVHDERTQTGVRA
jgi:hypothetical protein